MIAGFFNFVVAAALLGGISYLFFRYASPAIKKYRDGERRAAQHEAWVREQAQRDQVFRDAATEELNEELGDVAEVVDLKSKE